MCQHDQHDGIRPHCCPTVRAVGGSLAGVTRRGFLGGTALGAAALSGLSWSALAATGPDVAPAPPRRPLVVKPVFLYQLYQRRPQTSWRSWGGIHSQQDADQEVARIQGELEKLQKMADFPLQFQPLTATSTAADLAAMDDVKSADALLVYACDGDLNQIAALGKDTIFFLRHQSGPLYLYYEIISPRFLRQHGDALAVKGIDDQDVVVDKIDEVLWRLRSLCGLRNTMGTKILAVGGPGAWAHPAEPTAKLVSEKFKFDIQTVTYDELGKLIQAARQDQAAVALAKKRAADYLQMPETKLETEGQFVENCMLLDQVFRKLMQEAGCRALTINACMGTIMPIAETTACLTLSTLNDDGYFAFCESDFIVIPAGVLMGNISGQPTFLNDPTYPHDGVITLAHCTAPRRMDGKNLEPVRLVTHFESDYGAAPKVEMHTGQKVTNIAPDFAFERWLGLSGEIVAHPFLPICRSQIDIRFTAPSLTVAEKMPGFHWMTIYGDYLREAGYALKRIPIQWECLG